MITIYCSTYPTYPDDISLYEQSRLVYRNILFPDVICIYKQYNLSSDPHSIVPTYEIPETAIASDLLRSI